MSRLSATLPFLGTLLALSLANAQSPISVTKDTPEDVFAITTETLVKNPPLFGTNIQLFPFRPWVGTRMVNIWNDQCTFEPILFRHLHTLSKPDKPNTPDEITEIWGGGKTGFSYWGKLVSGTLDGAEVIIYRNEKGTYQPIHQTTVKQHVAEKGVDERIVLSTPMPSPAGEGDILVFTKKMTDFPVAMKQGKPEKGYGFFAPDKGTATEATLDTATFAPEGGSTASMKITMPGGGQGMSHQYMGGKAVEPLRFKQGIPYKGQIWLRQDGVADGKVTLQVGNQTKQTFDVTGNWKKYEFEFQPDNAKEPAGNASRLKISTDKPGTVWADNLLVWQTDTAPFAVLKQHSDELKQWKPGMFRLWEGLERGTMEAWLSDGFAEQNVASAKTPEMGNTNGLSLNKSLELCAAMGDTPATRSNPWLVLYPAFSDAELSLLMEYLAGDTSTPGGKLRASHGHPEPWSKQFEKIYFEVGNETWNMSFLPLAWPGKADIYSALANRSIAFLKKHPLYDKERMVGVACGWKDGPEWTKKVAEACTEADMIDFASYYGGWDGVTVMGASDKDFYTNQLLYSAWIDEPKIDKCKSFVDAVNKSGRKLEMSVYEGGPGYAVPTPAKPWTDESESVGKSLALGTLTLDAYLSYAERGFTATAYFLYKMGTNWASHSDMEKFVPFPSWLALQLRNHHCKGDLMKVIPESVRTMDVAATEVSKLTSKGDVKTLKIPAKTGILQTTCHAFADGKKHAFILINRSYDEPRKVVLKLPYDPQPKAVLHKLTHEDPKAHNRTEPNVKLSQEEIGNFSKTATVTVPPASVVVVVNEGK